MLSLSLARSLTLNHSLSLTATYSLLLILTTSAGCLNLSGNATRTKWRAAKPTAATVCECQAPYAIWTGGTQQTAGP